MITPITESYKITTNIIQGLYKEIGFIQPTKSVEELEEKYTTKESKFDEVDGCRVHYRDEGDKDNETILLLHGTASSLHTYDRWADILKENYRVVRLDLPGFGLTGPYFEKDHKLGNLIETVSQFIDHLELNNITIVGNSLGGAVAWRVGTERDDVIDKIVLIDSGGASLLARFEGTYSVFGLNGFSKYITPRQIVRVCLIDAYGDPTKIDSDLIDRYYDLVHRDGNRQAVVEIARNYVEDHVDDKMRFYSNTSWSILPSFQKPSPEPQDEYSLEDITQPVLFQWGKEDRWLPVEFGKQLADKIEKTTFLTYSGVGHIPMEESPNLTAMDLKTFIDNDEYNYFNNTLNIVSNSKRCEIYDNSVVVPN